MPYSVHVLFQILWKWSNAVVTKAEKQIWPLTFRVTLTSRSCILKVTQSFAMIYICTTSNLMNIGEKPRSQSQNYEYDLWPWDDLDLKVIHNEGHRITCHGLHIPHVNFGENRWKSEVTVAKILIWPLTLRWPWPQGHILKGNSTNIHCTKFGKNWMKGLCTVAKTLKVTCDLGMTLTFDLHDIQLQVMNA